MHVTVVEVAYMTRKKTYTQLCAPFGLWYLFGVTPSKLYVYPFVMSLHILEFFANITPSEIHILNQLFKIILVADIFTCISRTDRHWPKKLSNYFETIVVHIMTITA